MLRESQQELLNGVRYADAYLGRQEAIFEVGCVPFTELCAKTFTLLSWPLAADNHYFNPDTGRGFNPGGLGTLADWSEVITFLAGGFVGRLRVQPPLESGYPSALQMFDEEYATALYFATLASALGIVDPYAEAHFRKGMFFYLGWASHLMQDQTVVHHTFDEARKHHREYEQAADGLVTTAPIANGQQIGIYDREVPGCRGGSRSCFASYAAHVSHDAAILKAIDNEDYSNVRVAVPFAQSLQAGLYAAFLEDIGLLPVHMSAVMAVL
jgi:hypothetical protein